LSLALAAVVGLHWLVICSFPHWWGGHSVGPRFFSDMVPYLLYFFGLTLTRLDSLPRRSRAFAGWALTVAVAFSFFVAYRAANNLGPYAWNSVPVNVDVEPSRIWDWEDPQFLRFIPVPSEDRQ